MLLAVAQLFSRGRPVTSLVVASCCCTHTQLCIVTLCCVVVPTHGWRPHRCRGAWRCLQVHCVVVGYHGLRHLIDVGSVQQMLQRCYNCRTQWHYYSCHMQWRCCNHRKAATPCEASIAYVAATLYWTFDP